jgi:hypothetical protein
MLRPRLSGVRRPRRHEGAHATGLPNPDIPARNDMNVGLLGIRTATSAAAREMLILTPECYTLVESSLSCRAANGFRAGRSQMPIPHRAFALIRAQCLCPHLGVWDRRQPSRTPTSKFAGARRTGRGWLRGRVAGRGTRGHLGELFSAANPLQQHCLDSASRAPRMIPAGLAQVSPRSAAQMSTSEGDDCPARRAVAVSRPGVSRHS